MRALWLLLIIATLAWAICVVLLVSHARADGFLTAQAPRVRVAPPVAVEVVPPLFKFDHNGSLMDVFIAGPNGGNMSISYNAPRPGLWDVGVTPGTLLFRGLANGAIQGTAFVFAWGCPPVPYPVSGRGGPNLIELHGAAPVIGYGCVILGYTWASPNAHLFFSRASP